MKNSLPRPSSVRLAPLEGIAIPVLLTALFTMQILNILVQPGVTGREAMLNMVDLFFIKPLLVLLVAGLLFKMKFMRFRGKLISRSMVIWAALCIGRAWQSLQATGGPNLLRYATELALMIVGFYVASQLNGRSLSRILLRTFWASVVVILIFGWFMVVSDRIIYAPMLGLYTIRPQDIYSLIHSTEFSNILSQLLIIGLVLISGKTMSRPEKIKAVWVFLPMAAMAVMIMFLLSVATIVLWCAIVSHVLFLKYRIKFYGIVAVVAVLAATAGLPIMRDLVDYKLLHADVDKSNYRAATYVALVSMIQADPVVGVGIGQSVFVAGTYPHNNVLGSWVEGGLPTFLFYIFLLFLFLRIAPSCIRSEKSSSEKSIIIMCSFYSLFYWHAKGLVQDTWLNYEILLWTVVLVVATRSIRVSKVVLR